MSKETKMLELFQPESIRRGKSPATGEPREGVAIVEPENASVLSEKIKATIAMLDSWIEEGLKASPEEKRQSEIELTEFKKNMNANRALTGDSPIYP